MTSARTPLDKLRLNFAITLYEKRSRKIITHIVSHKLSTISNDSIILISSGGDLISRLSLVEIDEQINEQQRYVDGNQPEVQPVIIDISLNAVDKVAQQKLLRDHFSTNWCIENLVVPIKVELSEKQSVLFVGICNSAYIRTVDSILKNRLDIKFLEIKYVIVEYDYPLKTVDEFLKAHQSLEPLSPKKQQLVAVQRVTGEMASSREPLQSVSGNTKNINNSEYINLAQLLANNQKISLMLLGAGITAFALFLPALKVPLLGSITYLHNGRGDGIFVLVCTVMVTFLLLNKKIISARYLSCAGMVVQFTTISAFYQIKSAIQSNLDSSLSGNPFRGLADAALSGVSLEWAWFFLLGGTISTIAASLLVADPSGNQLRLPRHCIYPQKGLYQENLFVLLGLPLVVGWLLGSLVGK